MAARGFLNLRHGTRRKYLENAWGHGGRCASNRRGGRAEERDPERRLMDTSSSLVAATQSCWTAFEPAVRQ